MNDFGLKYCKDALVCYSTNFNLKYNYYEGYQGDGQKSGAYIFRPSEKTKSAPLSYASPQKVIIFQGKNLIQVHIDSSKIIADLRIYNDFTNGVELQSFVDSIDTSDGQGKEVVLVINTPSIKNGQTFWTDSMGMEMQKRVFNYRPTWNLQVNQPVSGNYYPILSTIFIQDVSSNETLS